MQYLDQPSPPQTQDLLDSSGLKIPFFDPNISQMSFREAFGLLFESEYGKKLAELDLRYVADFGYKPRELVAVEYGLDAHPVSHNFSVYAHTLNAMAVEEAMGREQVTPREKDIALFSSGTHDVVEGIVGDMPRGTKTQEFRQLEDDERWKMFTSVYEGVLPEDFLLDVHNVIGHRKTGTAHDYFELGHALSQFSAGLRVGRQCFSLLESDFQATPLPVDTDAGRRKMSMCAMASEVTLNGATTLEALAEKGHLIASSVLAYHRAFYGRIQEQLKPLAEPSSS